jgi:hypothetical protein
LHIEAGTEQGNRVSKVLLNGRAVADCRTLNTAEGWVEVLVRNPDGSIEHNGREIKRERRYGEVTVEFKDD